MKKISVGGRSIYAGKSFISRWHGGNLVECDIVSGRINCGYFQKPYDDIGSHLIKELRFSPYDTTDAELF